jgi:hypothetical protein
MILWPSTRLGIVIDAEVHCALVRGERVVWSHAQALADDPVKALATAIRAAPFRSRSTRAVIALGAAWTQYRLLRGLPPVRDDRVVRSAIAGSASRFFLGRNAPMLTTGVAWVSDADGWCAAFEQSMVESLCVACAREGVRLTAVVPLEGFIGRSPQSFVNLEPTHALAHAPGRTRLPLEARELAWPAIGLAAASLLLIAAPTLAASTMLWRAERELRALAPSTAAAMAEGREVNRLQGANAGLTRMFAGVRSKSLLLASVADALPDGAFLRSLRSDSAGVVAVVIARRADDVLKSFERIPGVGTVEVAGPIAHDPAYGAERERLTVRITWSASRASSVAAK